MNKIEIYDLIVNWEKDAGEDFIDRFDSNIVVPNYMMWCLGRGYLSTYKFNLWEQAVIRGECWADFATSVVYSDSEEYAVVYEEEMTEDGHYVALHLLAEFISESIIYQQKLKDFLKGDGE